MLSNKNIPPAGRVSTDIDDQSIMLDGWEQQYTQLESGAFEARVFTLPVSDGIDIFRKSTNRRMHKSFVSPGVNTRLAVVLPGSDLALFQGKEISSGDIFVIKPEIELDLICHGNFDVVVVPLDTNLNIIPCEEFDHHKTVERNVLPQQLTNGFAERLFYAFSNKKGMSLSSLLTMSAPSVRALCQTESQQCQDVEDAATKSIQFVEQYLNELNDLPTIPEIASFVGISERALEYTFSRKYGISPMRYFTLKRLHGARRDIREKQLNVTNAAMKWGFNHLGRFSGAYRNIFGELPSHTSHRIDFD